MNVGQKIKMIRRTKNMSQAKLSAVTGISRSYISEMEKGKYENISINVLCDLCRGLEVTPNDLISEEMYK